MTDVGNLGQGHDDRDPNLNHDLRRLSQAPLAILSGWIELWNGYTIATQTTLNLFNQTMGRATEELSRSMRDMRQQMHQIGR